EDAKRAFEKSLTEYRDPDVQARLRKVEAELKERDRRAYLSKPLSEEAREKGNAAFKAGKFAEAKALYDEAIRRDPEDARNYSNRAACLTKLMEFQAALADSDNCIQLDPKFVKGYTRKGAILCFMKEWHR